MSTDPGVALRASSLAAAFGLLHEGHAQASLPPAAKSASWDDEVEDLALASGMRSRRVLLQAGWWKQPRMPMLARVADRRREPRGDGSEYHGWVALLPDLRGYRMRSLDAAGHFIDWRVDAGVARRLGPFGFTFQQRLPLRPLAARDVVAFAMRSGAPELAMLVMAGLIAALVGLLTPVATGWLIDHAIPAANLGAIGTIVAALAVAGIALIALDVLREIAALRLETRVGVAMQAALVDRVVSAPAAFFRAYSSGDLALRMGAVHAVQRSITGSVVGSFVTSIFLAANLGLMLAYSSALTLAAAGIALLVVAVSITAGMLRLRIGPRIEALDGQLGAMTFQFFAGISKLRAAAAEARAFRQWHARYSEFRDANRESTRLSNWESVALSVLYPAATILVLALAWQVAAPSGLTTGSFVAFHAAMFALLGGVQMLVSTALDVVNLRPVWERARPILATPPEDARRGERHDPAGEIELQGVTFAYPGGPEVLRGIDLHVRPGELVAIVGASGSGKSTLLRLLLGFEAPTRGSVRYDGRDLARIDLRHLRTRLGTVLQDGRLWAGDLYTNIVGATNLDVESAWEAARAAGLAADIEAMPMGMYTIVGEGVSTLSGGQRQRVLIARALVGKPRVVLLDEATSALDNLSQAAVLRGLAELEATRIVIAHRLSTVRDADRIVVLEGGRIAQQGTYAQLAAAPGPFAAMLQRQTA